jgi:hypothetical protein
MTMSDSDREVIRLSLRMLSSLLSGAGGSAAGPLPRQERGALGLSKLTDTPPILTRLFPGLTEMTQIRYTSTGVTYDLTPYLPIAQRFCSYLLAKAHALICLKMWCPETDEEFIQTFPYPHRWKTEYKARINAMLFDLGERVQYDGPWSLLTLTAGGNLTIPDGFLTIQKSRYLMLKILRKLMLIDYFWILEPHRTGWPHCHMMLPCDLSPFTEHLKTLWTYRYDAGSFEHGLDISVTDGKIDSLRNYLMAYLRPTLDVYTMTGGDLAFNSVAWSMSHSMEYPGIRFWGASSRFRRLMTRPKGQPFNEWMETGIAYPDADVRWLS